MTSAIREFEARGYRIRVFADWDKPDFTEKLVTLSDLSTLKEVRILQDGRHKVIRATMPCGGHDREVVIKTYGRQSAWRDYIAKRGKGSKAVRAFNVAALLREKNVNTPAPIAVIERWTGNRLEESHFLCEYVPALSDFRQELNHILRETQNCEELMNLIEKVALEVRKFHDAGVIHCDLGNQNIGLQKNATGSWDVLFIDLNRAQIYPELTEKQRGKDLARLDIPSAFFAEFLSIYEASAECRNRERKARKLFELHTKLRPLRHPIREYRIHGRLFQNSAQLKNAKRNLWIWDERSAQPVPAYNSKDRRGLRPPGNIVSAISEWIKHGFEVRKIFRKNRELSFSGSVPFDRTIGMALDANPETWEAQRRWLRDLQGEQRLPILLRVYHHKGESHRVWTVEKAKELKKDGHPVALALVQDRNAVLTPQSWDEMLEYVISETASFADFYEIGHVTNRGKWGIWDVNEYVRLLSPALKLKKRFPKIRLSGPACIDFDLHLLPALLGKIPSGSLDALSQHLYVDRRGAPENRQGSFDTVGKCALHSALACAYGFKEEKIIISEVNWPIAGTGHWSPVGSPYTLNGPWAMPPSATEEDYAKFMCRYLLLSISSGHVSRVYWWRLAAKGYGLIDDTGTPNDWRARPAFYALQKLLSQLAGTRFERRILDVPEGTYALEFSRKDDSRFTLRWDLNSHPEIR